MRKSCTVWAFVNISSANSNDMVCSLCPQCICWVEMSATWIAYTHTRHGESVERGKNSKRQSKSASQRSWTGFCDYGCYILYIYFTHYVHFLTFNLNYFLLLVWLSLQWWSKCLYSILFQCNNNKRCPSLHHTDAANTGELWSQGEEQAIAKN